MYDSAVLLYIRTSIIWRNWDRSYIGQSELPDNRDFMTNCLFHLIILVLFHFIPLLFYSSFKFRSQVWSRNRRANRKWTVSQCITKICHRFLRPFWNRTAVKISACEKIIKGFRYLHSFAIRLCNNIRIFYHPLIRSSKFQNGESFCLEQGRVHSRWMRKSIFELGSEREIFKGIFKKGN